MENSARPWKYRIASCIRDTYNIECGVEEVLVNKTPDISQGDLAFPMFILAKKCKVNPVDLSRVLSEFLNKEISNTNSTIGDELGRGARIEPKGPYLNVFLDRVLVCALLVNTVQSNPDSYGENHQFDSLRVMIEFSAPNTNKPLHLGHLRNDALGESVSRILKSSGAEVCKVNLINDRGIHICKSMLAYQKFGNGESPESVGKKSDHFVGDYYVKFSEWQHNWDQDKDTEVESPSKLAQDMLVLWEQGDTEVQNLWKKMNSWAIQGMMETYMLTNVSFDKTYLESETYLYGKDAILGGLERGVFEKDEEGAVVLHLDELQSNNSNNKVLLRSDGTSVYITQDIGTVQKRFEDWKFDKMIYVVASEQNYHFKVLFYALQKLGFPPAVEEKMYHLAYGLVHLPSGRMKSREGTVVDADMLIQELSEQILQEIYSRGREKELQNVEQICQDIALGAIHYFLLSVNPKKDLTFDPLMSIQFQGNTGPYLQYTCARINSMIQKYSHPSKELIWSYTISDDEWSLILYFDNFPNVVLHAAQKYDPSLLANYLYELASLYSKFYQNIPILNSKDEHTRNIRMAISHSCLIILRKGMYLLNIPYLEKM